MHTDVFVTTSMVRTAIGSTRTVDISTKDFLLNRLLRAGEGHTHSVLSLRKLFGDIVDGYDQLIAELRQTNWTTLETEADRRAIDHFLRHDATHREAAASDANG